MAGTVYTRRFTHAQLTGTGDIFLWTPDDQFSYILRDIIVANQSNNPLFYSLYIKSGPVNLSLAVKAAVATKDYDHLELRQPILSPEELRISIDVFPVSILVAGYALS